MKTRSQKPSDGTSGKQGRVTLVGAGPGDPDLLTIKAVRAMQEADIILFDALVSEEVLAFARSNAKRMLVGKRGHRPSCRQEDINDLMLKLARQGKHVVRLKCGDPVLFGRAGEEIAHLAAAGIPVSIVPGITSASAMASLMHVSLTHRHHAHSVRFVTGHPRNGVPPEGHLDWKGLADPATTLVIYMGGRTGPAAARRLIAEGLAPETPCAVVMSVSRSGEKRHFGTLRALADGELRTATDEPVLIGIGAVFAVAAAMPVETRPAVAAG
jgi:uroporphyrin-III C-methyltransferase/precorrin-2 dehydrogenase/sirohydrochlorin ferrochelatase